MQKEKQGFITEEGSEFRSLVLTPGFFSLALLQARRPGWGDMRGAEGEDRQCPYLMMPADLVELVVEACRWGGGGWRRSSGEECCD